VKAIVNTTSQIAIFAKHLFSSLLIKIKTLQSLYGDHSSHPGFIGYRGLDFFTPAAVWQITFRSPFGKNQTMPKL
jgi:hypothetical protein